MSELIPVTFNKILQSRAYTVIILATSEKKIAIYTSSEVGKNIQLYLTKKDRIRPLTYDLFNSIFQGFNIKILQIVINDIEDTVYFARIFLEQKIGEETCILEIDARPSDCIILALMNNTPVFCRKEVIEKSVAVED